jgi:hypothetical protein
MPTTSASVHPTDNSNIEVSSRRTSTRADPVLDLIYSPPHNYFCLIFGDVRRHISQMPQFGAAFDEARGTYPIPRYKRVTLSSQDETNIPEYTAHLIERGAPEHCRDIIMRVPNIQMNLHRCGILLSVIFFDFHNNLAVQADESNVADKPTLWLSEQATHSLRPTGITRAAAIHSLQTLSSVYSAAIDADYVDSHGLFRYYCREIFDNLG